MVSVQKQLPSEWYQMVVGNNKYSQMDRSLICGYKINIIFIHYIVSKETAVSHFHPRNFFKSFKNR
jgi:hypothetical protein